MTSKKALRTGVLHFESPLLIIFMSSLSFLKPEKNYIYIEGSELKPALSNN